MKVVARVLVGSQNYHLDGPDSDYDYKLLMLPEFKDFYSYHKVDKTDLPKQYDPEHYSVMSLLTFDANLRKGNVNALEMLFSHEFKCYGDFPLRTYLDVAYRAYYDGYLASVWTEYLRTVEGMVKNTFDRYGLTRKSASRAEFLLDFARYVASKDYVVSVNTWTTSDLWTFAWRMRYDTNLVLPDKDYFYAKFEDLKATTLQENRSMTLNYEKSMADTMKELVFRSLEVR